MGQNNSRRESLRRLRDVLIQCCDDKGSIWTLTDEAGIDRTGINLDGPVRDVWHRIVIECAKSNSLDTLIAIAERWFPAFADTLTNTIKEFNENAGDFWIPPDDVKAYQFNPACPYPGLKRFNQSDHSRFFGRDGLIRELLRAIETSPLVTVIGHSGSGKSSVVRAGVLPQWLSSRDVGKGKVFTLTPDVDPFEALYVAMAADGDFEQHKVAALKIGDKNVLTKFIDENKRPDQDWLLFVDQFEEIFTRIPERDKGLRDCFVQSVIDVTCRQDAPLKVVLAVRDDFFGHLREYPELYRITDRSLHRVIELEEDALSEVIERPAVEHGVEFGDGLVEEIVRHTKGRRGMLPLLQYTLRELWGREFKPGEFNQRLLARETYDALGGVLGALRGKLQFLYRGLAQADQRALRRIMLCTIEISELETGIQPISRRAKRTELQNADDEKLLDRLIDQEKLLVSTGEDDRQFELPHEAMIQAWPEFDAWVREAQEAIRLRNDLLNDAKVWLSLKNKREGPDELWRGSKLNRAIELSAAKEFDRLDVPLNPAAADFLSASQKASITEQEARLNELEEAKTKAESDTRRAVGRQMTALASFLIAALIALGTSVWLLSTRYELAGTKLDFSETKSDFLQFKSKSEEQVARGAREFVELRPVLLLPGNKLPQANEIPKSWRLKLGESAEKISRIANSVGFLRARDDRSKYLGTCFVVGPNLVATPQYVINASNGVPEAPNLELGFEDRIGEEAKILNVDKIAFQQDPKNQTAIVLLEVPNLDIRDHPPLPISGDQWDDAKFIASQVGREIALFGYPSSNFGAPDEISQAAFGNVFDRKRMMIGTILDSSAGSEQLALSKQPLSDEVLIRNDALGSTGCAGAPVIDLTTWSVIGMHHTGLYDSDGGSWRRTSIARPAQFIVDALIAKSAVGYNATFLGTTSVPLPKVPEQLIGDILDGKVISATHYSFVLHEGRGMPIYVAYNIDREHLISIQRRIPDLFVVDPKIPASLQNLDFQYRNNDFDRGHMIPLLSVNWGAEAEAILANREVFYFSVTCPQLSKFNQRDWSKLEQHEQKSCFPWAKRLCVFAGPVFRRADVEYRRIRVPRSYWKIIVGLAEDGQKLTVEGYVMDQYEPVEDDSISVPAPALVPVTFQSLKTFRKNVAEIEQLTLLDFGTLRTVGE